MEIKKQINISTLDLVEQVNKDEYLIKLCPAQNRHSVPIYVPKNWEGKRIIIIKLKDD